MQTVVQYTDVRTHVATALVLHAWTLWLLGSLICNGQARAYLLLPHHAVVKKEIVLESHWQLKPIAGVELPDLLLKICQLVLCPHTRIAKVLLASCAACVRLEPHAMVLKQAHDWSSLEFVHICLLSFHVIS